ncbi:MAG: AhpC/TSA family protein [Gemmataceae bacterium]|nr:AhpC/TSA family protein [Gemmataceae bacterium]
MQSVFNDVAALPARVVAISFAPPERVAFFLRDTQLSFPVLSDGTLEGYRAFGLTRASWISLLRPDVIWRYMKAMFRVGLPTKPTKGDDLMQLGGDFAIDAEGIVCYAHRSSEPTDRPSAAKLLDAIKQARKQSSRSA